MINYKFNKNTGIVESIIQGENSINDFVEYFNNLSKDKDLPKDVLKIFSDGSKGSFSKNVTVEDMSILAEAIKVLLNYNRKVYSAFLISSSLETAMAELYKSSSKSNNYHFKIFSTKKNALNWLINQ